jgi:DNA-binding MarR family transcriptional regulator
MRESAIDRLYQALATLMRRRPELSAEVHPDFSLTGYTMLREVEAAPGTRATDLADLFGLDKSTVSRQLNELQAAGLIRREGEQPGRRGQALALTSDGQRRLEVEAEQARQHFSDRLAAWKNRDLTAFAEMVERFLDDVSN